MKTYQPTASELAILTLLMIQRYESERGKEVSRLKMSRNSLKKLAIRDRLRDSIIDEWIDVMALEHKWITFIHDEEFLLIKSDATQSWTKIASKRCDDIIKRLRKGDSSAISDVENEIVFGSEPDDDWEAES